METKRSLLVAILIVLQLMALGSAKSFPKLCGSNLLKLFKKLAESQGIQVTF
jgi:hypothetical protein